MITDFQWEFQTSFPHKGLLDPQSLWESLNYVCFLASRRGTIIEEGGCEACYCVSIYAHGEVGEGLKPNLLKTHTRFTH